MTSAPTTHRRRAFIKSYGCQMNVYDSERMADVLADEFETVDAPEDADLIILNTCHIREKAAEKVYSELGKLRLLKDTAGRDGRQLTIGVAGCVAQAEGEEIARRAPSVDFVVGPQSYHRLPELVRSAGDAGTPIADDLSAAEKFAALDERSDRRSLPLPSGERASRLGEPQASPGEKGEGAETLAEAHRPARSDLSPWGRGMASAEGTGPANAALAAETLRSPQRVSAFLTVQEGCDKFCAFCVVPYTRGSEYSRPVDAIVAEAEALAAGGVREVTLLGQNVNAWHGSGVGREWGLGELLTRLASIDGLDRLRYTTSHPRDMDDALIGAHRDLPQLMPYLHLPVQAGSDRVLKAMNRRHTASEYLRLIERIRGARPDIALSGDFIVGFPGETEDDFAATLALVSEVGYASAFSFKYSPRPGTPAAEWEQVPDELKSERLQRLQALLTEQQQAFNRSRLGHTMNVLFEKKGRWPGQIVGRSPWLQPVQVDGPETLIGTIAAVTIGDLGRNSLYGAVDLQDAGESKAREIA